MSSNPLAGGISPGNQELGMSRNSQASQGGDWMGEQFCNSGEEGSSWFQHWNRPFIMEQKAENLLGPKGPEWGIGARTLLHQEHWGNTWKIPRNDLIYNSQLQQKLLDGGATPWVQETNYNGIGHLEGSSGHCFQRVPLWHRMFSRENLMQSSSMCQESLGLQMMW